MAYLEFKAWELQFTNVGLIKKSSSLLCKTEEMNLKKWNLRFKNPKF